MIHVHRLDWIAKSLGLAILILNVVDPECNCSMDFFDTHLCDYFVDGEYYFALFMLMDFLHLIVCITGKTHSMP